MAKPSFADVLFYVSGIILVLFAVLGIVLGCIFIAKGIG